MSPDERHRGPNGPGPDPDEPDPCSERSDRGLEERDRVPDQPDRVLDGRDRDPDDSDRDPDQRDRDFDEQDRSLDDPDLGPESLQHLFVSSDGLWQELECDGLVERQILGPVDSPMPPFPSGRTIRNRPHSRSPDANSAIWSSSIAASAPDAINGFSM